MIAWGGSAPPSAASATASIDEGDERSKPSGPGVRSGTWSGAPSAANRPERTRALWDDGPDAKPWR